MLSFLISPLDLIVSANETFLGDFRGLNGGLVGPMDGSLLGTFDGWSVAKVDGSLLGVLDGSSIGKLDGSLAGAVDGTTDG